MLCPFQNLELCGQCLATVNNCKYLGHWLSSIDNDNTDIVNQTRMLYA